MVEAMVALTLVDHLMMQVAQCDLFPNTETEQPNPLGKTARRREGTGTTTISSQRKPIHAVTGPVSQRVDEE